MTMNDIMDFTAFGPHLRIAFASTNILEIHNLPKNEWWKKEGSGVDFVRTLFPNISNISWIRNWTNSSNSSRKRSLYKYYNSSLFSSKKT